MEILLNGLIFLFTGGRGATLLFLLSLYRCWGFSEFCLFQSNFQELKSGLLDPNTYRVLLKWNNPGLNILILGRSEEQKAGDEFWNCVSLCQSRNDLKLSRLRDPRVMLCLVLEQEQDPRSGSGPAQSRWLQQLTRSQMRSQMPFPFSLAFIFSLIQNIVFSSIGRTCIRRELEGRVHANGQWGAAREFPIASMCRGPWL